VLLAITGSAAWLVIEAQRDPQVPFLKSDKRAEWILYPLAVEAQARTKNYTNMTAEFRRDFELISVPPQVLLHIRAFEVFTLRINDNEVCSDVGRGANWKKPTTVDVARYLKAGINKTAVRVHCRYGPPALWLCSENLMNDLRTDTTWQVCLSDGPAMPASKADDTRIYHSGLDRFAPLQMFARKSLMLIMFMAVSGGAFLLYNKFLSMLKGKASAAAKFSAVTAAAVLILFILIWAVEVGGNASGIPLYIGFDVEGHLAYINYLLNNGRIPLANEGWQTYQPPLYYIVSAAAVSASNAIFAPQKLAYSLKLIPFLCGLGIILVTFYAAKTVFPESKAKQALSAVFASIVPMNIYISHYISNESLCGFMMALSVLLTLHVLKSEEKPLKKSFVLGIVLGLSLLTKYTPFILLPVIAVVLLYEFAFERRYGFLKILGSFAAITLPIILIASWFYLRNWNHFGKIIVGNWDPEVQAAWWQDPGFHTYKHFLQFGKVFIFPYFAGFYSFFDALYSTFWGDGDVGGKTKYIFSPPWDYQYMSAVYLLAIPATILIIVGMFRAGVKAIRACSSSWLFILGSIFITCWSLFYMELRLARHNQTKAFYGLFMVVPISLLFVYGFDLVDEYFRKKFKIGRVLLFGWFGVLAISIFASFHIQSKRELIFAAVDAGMRGNLDEAIRYSTLYAETEPDSGGAYWNLAAMYASQRKYDEAIKFYRKAIELKEDSPQILSKYSNTLLGKPGLTKDEIAEAVHYAKLACEGAGYLDSQMVLTLAAGYSRAGNTEDALRMAQRAEQLALSADEKNIAELSRRNIQIYTEQIKKEQAGQATQGK
jgi:4-amino-4-deoxy-L-arabinose transferase-like glycosyltransferase